MEGYKKEFIEFMVRSGVLTFGDFVTKSGRKTPYFVNTGNYVTGEQMQKLGGFYAQCIKANISGKIDALFGPAYKGIPLSAAASIALYANYNDNVNYCFNRKEAKDHGEGGKMVGYKLKDGDRVVIIEDVITAGTSVRECLPLLKAQADVKIEGLIVSVDRMEKGTGDKTAIQELSEQYGIKTYPIVTVREIIDAIYNQPIDGKVYIDADMKRRMEEYLETYCVH
ncbi:MAG TPA: orotate phosphoribosyltransferase [Ruminiclostridium sp.]|nr:orotate phosphoribosyltransferase [Ruminiclostridium sp.]